MNVMTMAGIQHWLKKLGIDLGYYNVDNALFLHNIQFCLLRKSEGVSFNQAIKGLKNKFKVVDNFVTKENFNSHFEYEFLPKK